MHEYALSLSHSCMYVYSATPAPTPDSSPDSCTENRCVSCSHMPSHAQKCSINDAHKFSLSHACMCFVAATTPCSSAAAPMQSDECTEASLNSGWSHAHAHAFNTYANLKLCVLCALSLSCDLTAVCADGVLTAAQLDVITEAALGQKSGAHAHNVNFCVLAHFHVCSLSLMHAPMLQTQS